MNERCTGFIIAWFFFTIQQCIGALHLLVTGISEYIDAVENIFNDTISYKTISYNCLWYRITVLECFASLENDRCRTTYTADPLPCNSGRYQMQLHNHKVCEGQNYIAPVLLYEPLPKSKSGMMIMNSLSHGAFHFIEYTNHFVIRCFFGQITFHPCE